MVIRDYVIPCTSETFTLALPAGARPLSVAVRFEDPTLYVLVDPAAPPRPRRFALVGGSAQTIDAAALDYVGMFQLGGGSLVFHLFASHEE